MGASFSSESSLVPCSSGRCSHSFPLRLSADAARAASAAAMGSCLRAEVVGYTTKLTKEVPCALLFFWFHFFGFGLFDFERVLFGLVWFGFFASLYLFRLFSFVFFLCVSVWFWLLAFIALRVTCCVTVMSLDFVQWFPFVCLLARFFFVFVVVTVVVML